MWCLNILANALLASSAVSAFSTRAQKPIQPSNNVPAALEHESPARTALLQLHKSLVEIPSISSNELEVAEWLSDYLRDQGFTVETQEVSKEPKRRNVLAYLGTSRKTKTLLSSHIDTVPPFWPYERRGYEIWGRGSVDAKASVATQIKAVEALVASGDIVEGDVALLYVVGEEIDGDGMLKANDLGLSWGTVIFGEPTELKLATGHKGMVGIKISAHGKAGHSGYPELGRSANDMLIPALAKLQQVEWPSSERYGNTTCNIGRVEGGVAANVIAEEAVAQIAIRVAADAEKVKKVAKKALLGVTPDLVLEFKASYDPVPIDSDVDGFEKIVVNYGTDVPHLNGDHKRYLYGPGSILMAHSDHEHINITDLEVAIEGYKKLIVHSLT